MSKKDGIKYVVIGVAAVILMVLVFTTVYIVRTGEVGIVSSFGKVVAIQGEGLHFKMPLRDGVTILETREKLYYFSKDNKMDTSLSISTKDMQTINIELTVQAGIVDAEKLYTSFDGKHETRFIRPRVREIVQATISKYTIEEFVSKRTEISGLILDDLIDDFRVYGIVVSNISIINHDFSDAYENAVEQKKVAEQATQRARAEQEKLIVEAENKVKLAEYQLREKELQAQANKVESSSLSVELLLKMAIDRWDGKLPAMLGGDGVWLRNMSEGQ